MLQVRLILVSILSACIQSYEIERSNEIQTLKNRVTHLENEVSILKTENKDLVNMKSDVGFLLAKNAEIMEILTNLDQGQAVQSAAIQIDGESYLQTISGINSADSEILQYYCLYPVLYDS